MRRPLTAFPPAAATLLGSLALLTASPAGLARAAAQEARDGYRSTLDSVYTAGQAAAGKEVYQRVCSECHVLDWYEGDIVRAWEGAPLYNFYDLIRTTMPQSNPGNLRSRDYVAMIAYILELNGMPTGDEPLSARRSVLTRILFEWRDEP